MKQIYGIIALALVGACSIIAAPCWSASNECGNTPACGAGQPPEGVSYTVTNCAHTFCDDAITCPDPPGNKKRMKKITRQRYTWAINGVGYQCVGAGTPSWPGYCCNCNEPGVWYPEEPQ